MPAAPSSAIPRPASRHVVGRAEQYRDDYQARLAALRERLTLICRRLDWTFLIHRTDRPATEPLLALHARLADRHAQSAYSARGGRHERTALRLRLSADPASRCSRCR